MTSSSSSTPTAEDGNAVHLVVFIHGLWGTPHHLDALADGLVKVDEGGTTETDGSSTPEHLPIVVLKSKSNTGILTYDGIERCGERLTTEIEGRLVELAGDGQPAKRLSIVGYSLGGLIGRYAIGLLYRHGWFIDSGIELSIPDPAQSGTAKKSKAGRSSSPPKAAKPAEGQPSPPQVEAFSFTTFATPHVGACQTSDSFLGNLLNRVGGSLLSASGRQLFLLDTPADPGSRSDSPARPLISIMSDRQSIYMRALASFRRRSLYANVVNDQVATFYTTFISPIDPFAHVDWRMHPAGPVSFAPSTKQSQSFRSTSRLRLGRSRKSRPNVDPESGNEQEGEDGSEDGDDHGWMINYLSSSSGTIIDPTEPFRRLTESSTSISTTKQPTSQPVLNPIEGAIETVVETAVEPTVSQNTETIFPHTPSRSPSPRPQPATSTKRNPLTWFRTHSRSTSRSKSGQEYSRLPLPRFYHDPTVRAVLTVPFFFFFLVGSVFLNITSVIRIMIHDRNHQLANLRHSNQYTESQPTTTIPTDLENSIEEIRPYTDIDPTSPMIRSSPVTDNQPRSTSISHPPLRAPPPPLPLTTTQTAIIESLNSVGWQKFAVFIRKTTFSHAALIRRRATAEFSEGEAVVAHWVDWFNQG